MDTHQMLINGEWVNSSSGDTFEDFNPYTGDLYARVAKGGIEDANLAMEAAFNARAAWRTTSPLERAGVLFKAADIMESQMNQIADILIKEGGGTFGKAMFEISQTIDLLRTAAGDCKNIQGETHQTDTDKISMTMLSPKGTVVAISPWNFPLILSMYKVAYGLGTGNTVVFKPASETPVIGLKIGKIFEEAGLYPGALNVITGPGSILGDAMITHKHCSLVSITGETVTGKHVAQTAAAHLKEYILELGGKNPLVILKDADMNFAVNTAAFGTFLHQGQICMAVGRIIIAKDMAAEFAERLSAKAKQIPSGDPGNPETIVGPLVSDKQVQTVDHLVKDAVAKGATLLAGGTFEGRVYAPTVLSNVTRDMEIYYTETFGPVASIITAANESEALAIANDTDYGLSAGVITNDIKNALFLAEGLEAGMVHINNASIDAEASCPFGGFKGSGQGREGGRYSVEAYSNIKWVTMQKKEKVYPF